MSSLVGLAAPLLLAFYEWRSLKDIFDAPCRRSQRAGALVLAVIATPLLLGWIALVPMQWYAFFVGKGRVEVRLPLGFNVICLALELPLLPRALRLRQVIARFDEVAPDAGLDRRYRYPARVQRWLQGERLGYPVIAVPVDPERNVTSWLQRRFASPGELLNFEFVRQPGLVLMARARASLPASLELHGATGLAGINRTRVFSRPVPSSPRQLTTGDSAFDQSVQVHVAEAELAAAQALLASPENRTRLAAAFADAVAGESLVR